MEELIGIEYWNVATRPRAELTEAQQGEVVAGIRRRLDQLQREFWTAFKIDYCRHMDSPAWRRKLADIYERHPEWKS